MLSQSADAQALEKTVILGFNSKLASRVASFKAANSGVSREGSSKDRYRVAEWRVVTGDNVDLGLERSVYDGPEYSDVVWVPRRNVVRGYE